MSDNINPGMACLDQLLKIIVGYTTNSLVQISGNLLFSIF
jgi:hypothetical protein